MKNDYDVAIIGAGVSGSYLAYLLASSGIDVLLVEKSRKTKKDSGIVSTGIENFIKPGRKLLKSHISRMKFVSPGGKSFFLRSKQPFAYILHRGAFEKHIRKMAHNAGAKICYSECRGVRIFDEYAETFADTTYRSKMIVGCDGAGSLVRRTLGIQSPKIFHGLISEGRFHKKDRDICIYFNNFYSPHFFAWSIPKSMETGVITRSNPFEYLKYFQTSIEFVPKRTFYSMIPVCTTRSFYDRCLLVGDSCGQVKPVSGGGIIYSMTAANCAAQTICEAFRKGVFDSKLLSSYQTAWKREIGNEIRMQLAARNIYRKLSNRELDILFDDFGKSIENNTDFDYDRPSGIVWKMPRLKVLKYVLRYIPLMFEWSHD